MTTTVEWPYASEVFALTIAGNRIPLILIAIMTFVPISSSGTMAMAVNFGYRGNKNAAGLLMRATALPGLMFVGMQAFALSRMLFNG